VAGAAVGAALGAALGGATGWIIQTQARRSTGRPDAPEDALADEMARVEKGPDLDMFNAGGLAAGAAACGRCSVPARAWRPAGGAHACCTRAASSAP